MLAKELIHPESIAVIGGSNNRAKPGGKVLANLLKSNFKGEVFVVNPKEDVVQGIRCFKSVVELPAVDAAIISIPAQLIEETLKVLAEKKTKGYIILSAGFSETGAGGKKLEDEIVKIIDGAGGSLIGPNCIGLMTPYYNGVFTDPVPELNPRGCDFVSGSGATAVFILESAASTGLMFSSIYSVGNSAQIGVEEVVKHWDETFAPEESSRVKMIYMEKIDKPGMLLQHASSLIKKGCRIAAIKSGASEAGSRAASSHTGALASSDMAADALFKKAGIVRCSSREELVTVASIFMCKELTGRNIAVITHAGGPGVMLTDCLSKGGLNVPHIKGKSAQELLSMLNPGSSVANPIDFIATGTAQQLATIIDFVENRFDEIDAMAVIFGTPGLFKVFDAYRVIDEKMKSIKKPIYPILPSIKTAKEEIDFFVSKERVYFADEVVFGNALCKICHTPKPASGKGLKEIERVREITEGAPDGYLDPLCIQRLLDAAGIPRVNEEIVAKEADALRYAEEQGYPVVMKAVGPIHKTDVGGVALNIGDGETLKKEFLRIMNIRDVTSVLIQPMLSGIELFVGAKHEKGFGHLILCGLGGTLIEVFKDVSYGLGPLCKDEALRMIRSLKGYKIIKGHRGREGVNEEEFAEIVLGVSALLDAAPQIVELDLNPLLGTAKRLVAVDARMRIEKR